MAFVYTGWAVSPYCVVLITASTSKEADKISMALLKSKLAACVNVVPKITSSYWWKGRIEKASESLLIVKTKKSRVPKLIQKVKSVHSYTVPEVISLPILQGNPDYLRWIDESL